MNKKNKVKVNIKQTNSDVNSDLKSIKDGPEVRDIKESKGKKKFLKPKSSRIIEIGKNNQSDAEQNEIKHKTKKSRLAIILISIAALILISAGIYLGYFYINKDKIIKIVPQNTVFYTRLDVSHFLQSYENGQINDLISKFLPKQLLELGASDYFDDKIFDQYGLSYSNDIKPLLKDEIALSTLSIEYKDKEIITTAVVAELNNTDAVYDLISQSPAHNSTEESLFEGTVIYSEIYDENNLNFHYAILGNYVVLSKNINSIKEIINVSNGKKPSLDQSPKYRQAVSFLTRLNFLYAYADFTDVSFDSFLNKDTGNFNFKEYFPLYVFLNKLGTFSLHAEIENNGLLLQGFTPYKSQKDNTVNLSDYIPANTLGSLSGYNLREDLEVYLSLLEENNPALNSSFTKYKESLLKEYDIDINSDIYPFFENNTDIIVLSINNKDEMAFILNTNESSNDSIKKVENAITHYYGLINPRKEILQLSDGSLAEELYPDTESFEFREAEFENEHIRSINNQNAHTDFSYTLTDNKLIFGTSKEIVEEIISSKQNNSGITSQSDFKDAISLNNTQSANSILYINLTKVFEKIGLSKENIDFLNLKNFIFTSDSKSNGTSLSGSLLIK